MKPPTDTHSCWWGDTLLNFSHKSNFLVQAQSCPPSLCFLTARCPLPTSLPCSETSREPTPWLSPNPPWLPPLRPTVLLRARLPRGMWRSPHFLTAESQVPTTKQPSVVDCATYTSANWEQTQLSNRVCICPWPNLVKRDSGFCFLPPSIKSSQLISWKKTNTKRVSEIHVMVLTTAAFPSSPDYPPETQHSPSMPSHSPCLQENHNLSFSSFLSLTVLFFKKQNKVTKLSNSKLALSSVQSFQILFSNPMLPFPESQGEFYPYSQISMLTFTDWSFTLLNRQALLLELFFKIHIWMYISWCITTEGRQENRFHVPKKCHSKEEALPITGRARQGHLERKQGKPSQRRQLSSRVACLRRVGRCGISIFYQ